MPSILRQNASSAAIAMDNTPFYPSAELALSGLWAQKKRQKRKK